MIGNSPIIFTFSEFVLYQPQKEKKMDKITRDSYKYGIRKFFHTMYEKSMEAYETLSEDEKSELYDDIYNIVSGISFYSDKENHVHIQNDTGSYDKKTDVTFDFKDLWLTVLINQDAIAFNCTIYISYSNENYSFYEVLSELPYIFGDFLLEHSDVSLLPRDIDNGDIQIDFSVSKKWF